MPPERRRSRSVLAVLVLVALVLITVDYRQGGSGSVAALQRGAMTVFGPVQDGFATAVRPIGGFFSSIGQLGSLRAENQALQADLEELRQGSVSVAALEQENAELRALVGMQQQYQLVTTGGRVVAQPPNAFEWSVLLDVGADDGVAPGMAVVNAGGLVGKLTEVTRTHSRVQLLTSPSAGYAVRIAATGETGTLSGRGARPFQLEMSDPEAAIPPDAEVVTHAFQGTEIPDAVPVGVVETPPEGFEEGARFLDVRPYVDFTQLGVVLVVLNGPQQPEEFDPEALVDDPEAPRPPAPDRSEAAGVEGTG